MLKIDLGPEGERVQFRGWGTLFFTWVGQGENTFVGKGPCTWWHGEQVLPSTPWMGICDAHSTCQIHVSLTPGRSRHHPRAGPVRSDGVQGREGRTRAGMWWTQGEVNSKGGKSEKRSLGVGKAMEWCHSFLQKFHLVLTMRQWTENIGRYFCLVCEDHFTF